MALADRSPEMILARTRFAALMVLIPLTIAFLLTEEPVWRWAPLCAMIVIITFVSLRPERSYRLAINAVVVAPSVAMLITGGLASPFAAALTVTVAGSALTSGPTRGLVVRLGVASLALVAAGLLGGVPDFVPSVLDRGHAIGVWSAPLIWTYALLVFVLLFATSMASIRAYLDATRATAVRLQADLAENLRERNRDLTAISGSLAHELKNPLASIQGLATHLARKAEGPRAEQLGVMISEIHRMGDILNGLLDVSRPLGSLSLVDVELADVAREVMQMHAPLAESKGAALTVHGSGRARVDARKIRQILVNLVLNAIEAEARSVAVHIASSPAGVRVEVRDDGRGFEGEPARLLASGVTTKATGNGLGLAICAAIAEQHGGRLHLEARAPGAAAILSLPGGAT